MPKYKDSEEARNGEDAYSDLFEKRGLSSITHYRAKTFKIDHNYPIELVRHVWSIGDKYYKLAYEHYGSMDCWWIIAYFNKAPTEGHLNFGDEIYIPVPLADAKKIFGEK